MKLHHIVLGGLTLGILGWGLGSHEAAQAQNSRPENTREPVVVELFTSEGCSSCPPADALLAELDSRQPVRSAEIIPIEEHVDYWDQDGWLDPYSSAAWTARQREYTGVLRTGNPYTPEMVVDGNVGFVGSRGRAAIQEIEKAASTRKVKVEISEVSRVQGKLAVLMISVEKFAGSGPKDTPEVMLAITESGLHSAVSAGENSGKELHHSLILRELKMVGAMGKNGEETFTAQRNVKLDSKWKLENLRAVGFVQARKSRQILGAAEISLKP
ncbi:MAG: DUF1223 domain-containing protein [Candidatus Acidiferrum sp.]